MLHHIHVLPQQRNIEAAAGATLLNVLRSAGLILNAPCGGHGSCGKCKIFVNGKEALACRTVVDRDMTVALLPSEDSAILTDGIPHLVSDLPGKDDYLLAFDIGTTTVAGYVLDGKSGVQLACCSMCNPQAAFGADVISRIQHALHGHMEELTTAIRKCASDITCSLCEMAGIHPGQIRTVSIVGNPAMQQLFLGISPENLARIPFAPVLTQSKTELAQKYLPDCANAELLIVPDISGFVGADTVACVLATDLYAGDALTLLVDIGTNGELVLGNRHRMVACSTAAGPALEGANIRCGMRGQTGAIDHVWLEKDQIRYSVIGGGAVLGICGSGLIDAVAVALDAGFLNERGRIQNGEDTITLADHVFLTQDDIRQVQMAKGAIAAGIELMAAHLDVSLQDIQKVYLAGAFGTFMKPASACRIGLLPAVLHDKIEAVGNAAGSGAKLLACDTKQFLFTEQLVSRVEFLELATVPGFQRSFAKNMRF